MLPQARCDAICREIENILTNETDALISSGRKTVPSSGRQSARRATVGGRNLQQLWNGWREITETNSIQQLLADHLGTSAGLVRILYFDKPPGHGWALSLHRDQTIAVASHHDPPTPFSKPTFKAGVAHVQANHQLLQSMLTLRLHLDPMHSDNGPLIVVPNSHVTSDATSTPSEKTVEIHCNAGDVFVMRPLLSHGSVASKESCKDHRRVVHLECSPDGTLPSPYQWHQFDPIFTKNESR